MQNRKKKHIANHSPMMKLFLRKTTKGVHLPLYPKRGMTFEEVYFFFLRTSLKKQVKWGD